MLYLHLFRLGTTRFQVVCSVKTLSRTPQQQRPEATTAKRHQNLPVPAPKAQVFQKPWERHGLELGMFFPTKDDHFGVFWGYHHLRKHPYVQIMLFIGMFTPPSNSWKKGDENSQVSLNHCRGDISCAVANDLVEEKGKEHANYHTCSKRRWTLRPLQLRCKFHIKPPWGLVALTMILQAVKKMQLYIAIWKMSY